MPEDLTRSAPPDATRTADTDATVGHPVGEFTPVEEWTEIGRGAMGVVYKATQPGLNRTVAVKTLLGDDAPRHALRFLAEAEAVAAVDHPNVVKVYEFGRRDGRPFLAMEFLPGGTLADKLTGTSLPPAAAVLVRKIALGVGAAHAAGVIHRDLKPANVLFDSAGEPKVTDFGLAKRGAGIDLTHTQAVMGTPAYMSPEQAKGDTKFVGPPANVWAVGVILYEALTGTRPFAAADTWGMLQAVQHSEPADVRTVRGEIPRDLSVIVAKCLRKDPAERYATANELAADLGRFIAGESILARPPGSVERALKWAARKPAVAAGWGLGVVAALSLAVAGVTLKLKADADAARGQAEVSEGEAKQAKERAESSEAETNRAKEQLARAEYARTINLAHREYQRNDLKRADDYLTLCREDLRGWEWHYVHRLCHPEWEVIPEPLASKDQPCSADGRTFVTLDKGVVSVRRVGGEVVRVIHAGEHTHWASISPDAGNVATGDGDTCKVWQVSSGELVRTIAHDQVIGTATFSADGRELLVRLLPPLERPLTDQELDALSRPGKAPPPAKAEKELEPAYPVVAVWSVDGNEKKPKAEWRVDPNFAIDRPDAVKIPGVQLNRLTVQGTVFSQPSRAVQLDDGRLVVSTYANYELWSADGKTATKLKTLGVVVAAGSAPGVLVTCDKGVLSGVDVTADKAVWSVPIGPGDVTALHAHPDGDRVTLGRPNGLVEVWSVKEKKRVAEFRGFSLGRGTDACRLSGDGRWVVAGTAAATRVWRADQPAQPDEVEVPLAAKGLHVRVSTAEKEPRGVGTLNNLALRVSGGTWFGPGPAVSDLFRQAEGVRTLRRQTVSHRFGPDAFFTRDRSTLYYLGFRWTASGGSERPTLKTDRFDPFMAAVCTDAEDLVASWEVHQVREVNNVYVGVPGGKAEPRLIKVADEVKAAAFARTGHILYVVDKKGVVTAWDTDRGEKLWEAATGAERWTSSCVDASPDGTRVATLGPNDTVLLLDAATGAVVGTLRGHMKKPMAVRFSPNGKRLVSYAGRELKVWDPETGQDLLTLDCDTTDCLDFTPDGTRVLATGTRGYSSLGFSLKLDLKSVRLTVFGVRLSADRLFKVSVSYNCYGNTLTERVFDSRPVRAGR